MKTKFIFVLIFLCIVPNTFSQTNLNDYKYVIVPNSFDFLKYEDQYQLNSLTKFLFNKNGFTAIMEDEVWAKAGKDSLGLANYYEQHKSDFIDSSKLFVAIFTAAEKSVIDTILLILPTSKDYKMLSKQLV